MKVSKFKYLIILFFLFKCASPVKNYTHLHYHKPIPTTEKEVDITRAFYVKIRNKNEYIEYSKDYPAVKYYSNVDKKTNIISLKSNRCIYDGFIIEGEDWFRMDIIKALCIMENKCREEYDTIRNGIIDEEDNYHKGIRLIRQSRDYPTRALKETDEILLGKQDFKERQDEDFYKIIAAVIAGEGYRLIYWGEWGPLPAWWDKKEGIKLQHRVLKKLDASYHRLKHLEEALDEQNEEIFYQRLHEKD